MSKDYRTLQNDLASDLTAAAAVTSGARKVKLNKSDLRSLIPDGATVEVQQITFTKLQMGDVILVSSGRETVVRRFVKLKMTKSDTYLLTAYEGFDKKEALAKSCLIGKVVNVQVGDRSYDPVKEEGLFKAFWGKLTEYGTHKAFGLIG